MSLRYHQRSMVLACLLGGILLLIMAAAGWQFQAQAHANTMGHMVVQQASATPPVDVNALKESFSQRHVPPPINLLGHGARYGPNASTSPGEMIDVFVELSEPSIAASYAQAGNAGNNITPRAVAQRQLPRIEAAQQALIDTLTEPAIGATVLGRVQYVLNGIAIRVEASKLPQIRSLPGVAAVWPLRIGQFDTQSPPVNMSDSSPNPDRPWRRGPDSIPRHPVQAPVIE